MQKKKGRPTSIPKNFYDYDFTKELKKAPSSKIKMKLLALKKLQSGAYYYEVEKTFQVHRGSVKNWIKRFLENGIEGLKDKPGRGRKSRLSKDLYEEFKQAVIDLQITRSGGRINVKDITEMAKKRFGVSYKVKGMYDLLHRLGMVWISSRSVHPSCNKELQDAFKKTLRKKFKNVCQRERALLMQKYGSKTRRVWASREL